MSIKSFLGRKAKPYSVSRMEHSKIYKFSVYCSASPQVQPILATACIGYYKNIANANAGGDGLGFA
ncbi:MAG: hypothetical protein Q8Q91_02530 [Candidatus Daviesbacteria bacterium]|nr:hypothetical protein [Candidatus Daviesbacteria bacterium]